MIQVFTGEFHVRWIHRTGAEHDIVSEQDIEESARVLGASSQASTGRARAYNARA